MNWLKFGTPISILLILSGCSSTKKLSYQEIEKGEYRFNRKLQDEYPKFFGRQIVGKGLQCFAGPSFTEFNNLQPIKLEKISPSLTVTSYYQPANKARHEYSQQILSPFYGYGLNTYIISFTTEFASWGQREFRNLDVILHLKCKKGLICSDVPGEDFAVLDDPYEFEFSLKDPGLIRKMPVDLSRFTESEQTAIIHRQIFRGMSKEAAELAIGSAPSSSNDYRDVVFEENMVLSFNYEPKL
jgi:hypothetical protein